MKYFSKDRFCNFNIHYEAFFPFRYFCECMEKLGIRNAELIAGHQSLFMDDKHISNLTEQKKLLREHNIKVGSLCAQSCRFQYQFSAKEEDLREASFNFFSNGIKVAAELGAPLLQVNTGWGYMNEPKEEVFKRMTEMFGRLCDIGEKFGINIACSTPVHWVSPGRLFRTGSTRFRQRTSSTHISRTERHISILFTAMAREA